uniref:Gamma-aminobutyric acid receptor subunit beta n=1 Tax=Cacopsylla melanoneura TaxID=428564 RepID=A0A8D8VIX4_9HEMI
MKSDVTNLASWAFVWMGIGLSLLLKPIGFSPFANAAAPGGSMFGDVNISAILDSFSVSYDKRVRPNYGGLHAGFLLPSILDGSTARVPTTAGCRDTLGRVRFHQEHLGAGHFLCERETVLLPRRHDQQ